jgi:outer membrane protein assembly factor BamB
VRYGDSLFIACLHQGPSYVLAVDVRSGRDVWQSDRKLDSKGEALDSYSSPIVVPTAGGAEIVVSGADHINAYDPVTGRQLWISGGLGVSHPYGRTIAGPSAGEGAIVTVASGFQNRGRVLALKPGGRGDVTESHRLLTVDRYSPDCPCPVVYRGKTYFIRDDGMASCVDLKTGEAHWQERLFSENVKVSPVAGDGKIYFMSGQGNCVVIRAGAGLEVLATNRLDEASLSTPSISGGKVFIRTAGHLYAIK